MALCSSGQVPGSGRTPRGLRFPSLRGLVQAPMSPKPERTVAKLPVLLVLAGPAGSGKSTLCDRLVAANMGFTRVVTSTTRSPRAGEASGVHYHFFNPAEFDA